MEGIADPPDKSRDCCVALLGDLTSRGVKSPFSKQIILLFFDGTVNSVLQCGSCQKSFLSQIIDWDNAFDRRVFALYPLPRGVFEKVCRLFAYHDQRPNWPNWQPKGPSDELNEQAMDEVLELVLPATQTPGLIILADRNLGRIFACRLPEAEVVEELRQSVGDPISDVATPTPKRDWFAYLGTQR